jgi:hypothetical protein
MAAKDLITLARAYQQLSGVSGVDATLQTLITAVSDFIEKYCRRDFVSTVYDEIYNGNGARRLLLRQYPVISVQSVRYRPVTVLKVTNNDPTVVQARVSVLKTGIQLYSFQFGMATTATAGMTFAANPTISALTTAINGVGGQWSAQYVGDVNNYGAWPSADLYWPPTFPSPNSSPGAVGQGALSCVAGSFAELKMHTYELQGFQWDARGWLLRAIPYTDPELLHPEDLVFPTGINNFRIQYTAGYATVPEAVQEACAEWVAAIYFATQRDPALRIQSTPGALSQGWGNTGSMPDSVQQLLAPYRRHIAALGMS